MLKKFLAAAACAAMLGSVCLAACNNGGKLPEIPKGFSAEQHTATDFLLDKDGNPTHTTIFDFAERVNAAPDGAEFAELSSVVPARELFSIPGGSVVDIYAGGEYGYDVKVDGDFCNVILIDYCYEGEMGKDDEFQVTATVIMNQAFHRVVRGDGYSWLKYEGERPRYAVANPRFLGFVCPADGADAADEEYASVLDDSSLHIRESWVRYDNVLYKNGDYCGRPQHFSGTTVAASYVDGAAKAVSGLGKMNVTYYFDTVSDSLTTYCGGGDVGIGFYQRLFNTDYYTGDYLGYIKRVRVAGFNPYGYGGEDSVGGIILADVGASASFRVVPSKTCRLYIAGEFNIVAIDGDENNFTFKGYHSADQHFEYVAVPDESYISAYLEMEEPTDGTAPTEPLICPVYVYPGSVQKFCFRTFADGEYRFSFKDIYPKGKNSELSVLKTDFSSEPDKVEEVELTADIYGYTAVLEGGKNIEYTITVRNKTQRAFVSDNLVIEYIGGGS